MYSSTIFSASSTSSTTSSLSDDDDEDEEEDEEEEDGELVSMPPTTLDALSTRFLKLSNGVFFRASSAAI